MNTWDIYFATLVGMALHPGYTREGTKKPTLDELANLTDEMMNIRSKRTWPSTQPS